MTVPNELPLGLLRWPLASQPETYPISIFPLFFYHRKCLGCYCHPLRPETEHYHQHVNREPSFHRHLHGLFSYALLDHQSSLWTMGIWSRGMSAGRFDTVVVWNLFAFHNDRNRLQPIFQHRTARLIPQVLLNQEDHLYLDYYFVARSSVPHLSAVVWVGKDRISRAFCRLHLRLESPRYFLHNIFVLYVNFCCCRFHVVVLLHIYKTVKASAQRMQGHAANSNVQSNSTGATKNDRTEKKVLKTSFVVVCVYLTCWTPVSVIGFIEVFGSSSPRWAHIFAYYFVFCSSLTNPFIYGIMNPQFRSAFKKMLYIGRSEVQPLSSVGRGKGGDGSSARKSTAVDVVCTMENMAGTSIQSQPMFGSRNATNENDTNLQPQIPSIQKSQAARS